MAKQKKEQTAAEKAREFLIEMRKQYSAYEMGAFTYAEGDFLPSLPMISRVEHGQIPNAHFTRALLRLKKSIEQ